MANKKETKEEQIERLQKELKSLLGTDTFAQKAQKYYEEIARYIANKYNKCEDKESVPGLVLIASAKDEEQMDKATIQGVQTNIKDPTVYVWALYEGLVAYNKATLSKQGKATKENVAKETAARLAQIFGLALSKLDDHARADLLMALVADTVKDDNRDFIVATIPSDKETRDAIRGVGPEKGHLELGLFNSIQDPDLFSGLMAVLANSFCVKRNENIELMANGIHNRMMSTQLSLRRPKDKGEDE